MPNKYAMPKKTDWLRVTFDGKTTVCRDWDLVLKLAKKKNGNKKGQYFLDNGKVVFHEEIVLGKWKHERFADRKCTQPVKV